MCNFAITSSNCCAIIYFSMVSLLLCLPYICEFNEEIKVLVYKTFLEIFIYYFSIFSQIIR